MALRQPTDQEKPTSREIIEAIVPKEMPRHGPIWPWKSREDYVNWLLVDPKTEPHVRLGTSLAAIAVANAGGWGLGFKEAWNTIRGDPEYLLEVTKMPLTFIPKVRLSLLKAGAETWEDITQACTEDSFAQVNVDPELLRYGTVKVYSKTRADGSIAAGSGLDNEGAYGHFGWARDGGLVCDVGLDLAYRKRNPVLIDIVERQINYFLREQENDGRWSQRRAIHSSDFEDSDVRRGRDNNWADPQKDGTAAITSALVKYVKLVTDEGKNAVRRDLVRGSSRAIGKAVQYMIDREDMTWDVWEERLDFFSHTEAHMIKALEDALTVGSILFMNNVPLNAGRISAKAAAMREGFREYLRINDDDRRALQKFLGRWPRKDEVWIKEAKATPGWRYNNPSEYDHGPINSSAIEAVVETGILSPDHPNVVSHILLMDELSHRAAPNVNTPDHPLWLRYPGDIFDPDHYPPRRGETKGQLWSICSMWPAQHGYKLAHKYLKEGRIRVEHTRQLEFINKALGMVGDQPIPNPPASEDGLFPRSMTIDAADPRFNRVISGLWRWADLRFLEITKRFNPAPNLGPQPEKDFADRRIPEQYSRETGKPLIHGEQSLTWAYREFIKTVEYRLGLYKDWMASIGTPVR